MIELIYNTSSFLLFASIGCLCILISFIALKLIHLNIPLNFRYTENQATVSVSALLGIIYAVLIGFVVLYELNHINKVEDAEIVEAKTLFSIYRLAIVLPEPSVSKIRNSTVDYIKNTIYNEWPKMERGQKVDNYGMELIENISNEIRSFKNLHKLDPDILQALNEISINANSLFDIHQERVTKVHSVISTNIWFVLLLGSFLTLAVNFMLGMEFRLHMICISFISLMIAAVLYLVITLDRPYQGDFSIEPETFIATLEYITERPQINHAH